MSNPQQSERLYAAEVRRSPKDLGLTIVVQADSSAAAKSEAFRLYPEYKRFANTCTIYLLDHLELDWAESRFLLIKRDWPQRLPPSDSSDPLLRNIWRKRTDDPPPDEPTAACRA